MDQRLFKVGGKETRNNDFAFNNDKQSSIARSNINE